ncbi:MAG TPA: hypothetical protein PLT66_07845, partial [Bacillota bacterium]|nr:hypothetical protein [Bacillota bacterium]
CLGNRWRIDNVVIVQDEVEFVWEGTHTFPDDYPADGAEIEITGVFGTYSELGVDYDYILTEKITLIS